MNGSSTHTKRSSESVGANDHPEGGSFGGGLTTVGVGGVQNTPFSGYLVLYKLVDSAKAGTFGRSGANCVVFGPNFDGPGGDPHMSKIGRGRITHFHTWYTFPQLRSRR